MPPTVAGGAGANGQHSMEMLVQASGRVTMLLRDLVDQRRIALPGLRFVQTRDFAQPGRLIIRYAALVFMTMGCINSRG